MGLFFEDGKKGTRTVRKVAKGVIALGDLPLPVPLYGEPQVLPAAALDETSQRRLAAQIEAASQAGATAPRLNAGSNQRRAPAMIAGMPTNHHPSRRVAATTFRWMLPTRPRQLVMATDGKFGPPGRSPMGLFRLVHNRE